MTSCVVVPTDAATISGVLGYIDCQSRTIGAQGYLALTSPGSQVSLVLTAMLTILAALFGYRMLVGHTPDIREGVLTFARIGFVLALSTSWSAYRALAYDVALSAPAEIAAEIGGSARLPGTAGYMSGHLDAVDQLYQSVAIAGVGGPIRFDVARQQPPSLFPGFETFALGASRTAFLVGVIGTLGGTRLIAGLILAIGPLFFGFLLFDATRGLFGAWLRGLAGAALASLLVAITLGIEIALLEPWLSLLVQRRNAGEVILAAPTQLLAVSIVFAGFLVVSVVAGTRLAQGLTLAVRTQLNSIPSRWRPAETRPENRGGSHRNVATASAEVSRAAAIAETIRRSDQRGGSVRQVDGAIAATPRWRERLQSGPGVAGARVASANSGRRRKGATASAARRDRRQ